MEWLGGETELFDKVDPRKDLDMKFLKYTFFRGLVLPTIMINEFKSKYGPWAIVTGASDGIGKAVASELAKFGLNLVLVARRKELIDELASRFQKENGIQTRSIELDLSEAESSQKLLLMTSDIEVGLFAAIAGFGTSGNLIDSDLKKELNMIDVNCKSIVQQSYLFGQIFSKQGHGGIILMGSLVGFQGVPHAANYAATKAFVQTLAEGLNIELKKYGVDVLSVAPGPVASGFGKRADMNMTKAAQPEDFAKELILALGKKMTVRPGFLSKFLGYSLAMSPRKSRVFIMDKIMSEMTRHQK